MLYFLLSSKSFKWPHLQFTFVTVRILEHRAKLTLSYLVEEKRSHENIFRHLKTK